MPTTDRVPRPDGSVDPPDCEGNFLHRLNREVKEKWLTALRSGEYSQTHRVLKDERGYCCLGVLCDIHSKEGLGEWKHYDPNFGSNAYDAGGILQGAWPPKEVYKWAGTDNMIGLVDMNDQGKPFTEIAKVIEETY